jgi:hypothetical protein
VNGKTVQVEKRHGEEIYGSGTQTVRRQEIELGAAAVYQDHKIINNAG